MNREVFLSLRTPFRSFIKSACKIIEDNQMPYREWIRLTRSKDGRVGVDPEQRPDVPLAVGSLQATLASAERIGPVLRAVKREQKLAEALLQNEDGTPINSHKAQQIHLFDTLMRPALEAYIGSSPNLAFDDEQFNAMFGRIASELEGPTTTWIEISPLTNANLSGAEIRIAPDVSIVRLSDADIESWLNARSWMLPQPMPGLELARLSCAIKIISSLLPNGRFMGPKASDQADRLIRAIRLLTGSDAQIAFTSAKPEAILSWNGYTSCTGPRRARGEPILLGKSMQRDLKDIWRRLETGVNKDMAEVALRRWDVALDRLGQEDRLIDHWVALESLFLPDDSRELRFRASLRMAAFLGQTSKERQEIYKEMQTSYDLRSAIVHGNVGKKIRKLADQLQVFPKTREYLRRVLLAVIQMDTKFDPGRLESDLLAK